MTCSVSADFGTSKARKIGGVLAATIAVSVLAAQAGFASATTAPEHREAMQVIGADTAPPVGPGPGKMLVWKPGSSMARAVQFGKADSASGNSFYVAFDQAAQRVFIPTGAGMTYVLNAEDMQPEGAFSSPLHSRVARVSPDGKYLMVMSAKKTVVYTLPEQRQIFSLPQGGNAGVFSQNGKRAFIGGNMRKDIVAIDLKTGKVVKTYKVGHSGDLALADGKVFSADMQNGVMSAIDPVTGDVTQMKTPEVDPEFSYKNIMSAKAGFMQMATDPARHRLYVAGFSGHILRFSTDVPKYLGQVAVTAQPKMANKLSGLTLVDHGKEALTSVENQRLSVLVDLEDGHIVERLPKTSANRWIAIPNG